MSLFERFAETKEEGFREQFIKPLLVQLGFVNISNKHSSQEFGKDYVFSEIDRFLHYRHMVVQAKHEESINQGPKVDNLLSQVRQAFTVPYRLPHALHEERRVAAVYVFNTGKITENAQTQIREGLTDPVMRTNVHFFDGAQLEILRNSQLQRDNRTTRVRLLALCNQLKWNVGIIAQVDNAMGLNKQMWQVLGPITHGIEEFLTHPVATHTVDANDVGNLWNKCTLINTIVMRNQIAQLSEETQREDAEVIKKACRDATELTNKVIASIASATHALPAVFV